MNLRIHSDNWGELLLTNHFTHRQKDFIVPRVDLPLTESTRNGYLFIIRQFDLKLFTIRYCCFSSPSVTWRPGTFRFYTVLTKDPGKPVFHERSYNCFYDPGISVQYPIGTR